MKNKTVILILSVLAVAIYTTAVINFCLGDVLDGITGVLMASSDALMAYSLYHVGQVGCLAAKTRKAVIYTNDAQPTSWQDEGSALEKVRKDNDAQRDKNGMVKFNLNNEILVEITDKGWERLTEKNIEQYIDHCIKPNEVKIDGKTYYKLQAHQLGELFEPADWVTAIGPVKPVVMLYRSDLEDAKED